MRRPEANRRRRRCGNQRLEESLDRGTSCTMARTWTRWRLVWYLRAGRPPPIIPRGDDPQLVTVLPARGGSHAPHRRPATDRRFRTGAPSRRRASASTRPASNCRFPRRMPSYLPRQATRCSTRPKRTVPTPTTSSYSRLQPTVHRLLPASSSSRAPAPVRQRRCQDNVPRGPGSTSPKDVAVPVAGVSTGRGVLRLDVYVRARRPRHRAP